MIEQAKFLYSPLGKAFKKQTKMTEDQEENQIKALEKYGKQVIKSSGEKNFLELLKQNEIFDELVNKRMFEITKLSKGTERNSKILCPF